MDAFLLSLIVLMVVIVLTYIKEKFEKVHFFHTSVDVILLGWILSLIVKPTITFNEAEYTTLPELSSFFTLAYGLIFGSRIRLNALVEHSSDDWKMTYFPILFFIPILLGLWFTPDTYFFVEKQGFISGFVFVGIIMLTSSRETLTFLLKHEVDIPPILSQQFNSLSLTRDLLMIFLFAIASCFLFTPMGNQLTATSIERLVYILVISVGAAGGSIFLMGNSTKSYTLTGVLFGTLLFLLVMSVIFNLPPLVLGVLFGIVMSNFYHERDQVVTLLYRFERPVYVLIYVIAGFLFTTSGILYSLLLAALVILIRMGWLWISARQAYYSAENPVYWTDNFGIIFYPFGILALSMSINLLIGLPGALSEIIHGAIVFSVIGFQMLSTVKYRQFIQEYVNR